MKRNIKFLSFLLVLVSGYLNAQTGTKLVSYEDVYQIVESMPQFQGGMDGLRLFIQENLAYPEEAKKEKISGKVRVGFIVDETGNVTETQIVKGVHHYLNNEAIRLVQSMPRWIPGMQDGIPVKVHFVLPLNFTL